jgi:uncharacterized damage-inducible protein DinB
MDRAAIEELFVFTDYAWRRYEDAIRPLGDDALTRPAPGSGWPALRDALSHMTWAYVRWVANPAATTDDPVEPVSSWAELADYRRRVVGHAQAYFESLSDEELMRPREMAVDGEPLVYRPADILTNVMLHERQHHGDLNTLLYQLASEPPIVEFRFSLPQPQA